MSLLGWALWIAKQFVFMLAGMTLLNIVLPRIVKLFNPPKIGAMVEPITGLNFIKGAARDVPDSAQQAEREKRDRRVTVIEIWATWCGPCVRTIPHLTALARKYEDAVVFVGVTEENDEDKVRKFVEEMGDKMDYAVAMDAGGIGGTRRVFGQGGGVGIPFAAIVGCDGRLAWAGHPASAEMAETLERAVCQGKKNREEEGATR
ncbi:hypothetical protein HDU83_007035 [Entophlyctis luteolus]|nr:hypothetical protein HDU83_007035 [Entophlyctis luteolus]